MLRLAASFLARGHRLRSLEQTGAQVRSFAEATLQKPDIPVHGIHGRYALALFEAGAKQGDLDKIDADLKQINQLSEANKMFKQFLQDPSVPKMEKLTSLNEILKAMKVSETTSSLFEVLADNNRLNLVPKIAGTFEEIIASARGQIKAVVTTAEKLEDSQLATFRKGLEGTLQKGQSLILEQKVEPAIIGGLIIDIGEKHLDMSILTRVKKVEQMLRESAS